MKVDFTSEFHKNLEESKTKRKLEYFKNELINILEQNENKKNENISKAIEDYDNSMAKTFAQEFGIEKAGYGIGTIRVWKGEKFRKIAPGKWRKVYDSNTRGANQSIAIIKKKIQNAQSIDELLQIVMENTNRFMDSDGKLLPIVEKLKEAVNESKGRLNGDKTVIKEKRTDSDDYDFPESLRDNKIAEPYLDFIQNTKPVNPTIAELYKNINKLFKHKDEQVNDGMGTFIILKGSAGNFRANSLSPKLTVPEFSGNTTATTFIHEMAHAIDYFISNTRSFIDEDKDFDRIIRGQKIKSIPEKTLNYLKDNDYQGKKYVTQYITKYAEWNVLYFTKKGSSEYNKCYDELQQIRKKFTENENSYKYSSLCDILDALSGGEFWNEYSKSFSDLAWGKPLIFTENALPIGHGTGKDNFTTVSNRKMEIFADYLAMNYVAPEAVEVLREDFPELTNALDRIIDNISNKIKEI